MEEAANVVVLVVRRKKTLDFSLVERERGERDGPAEFTGLRTIVANQFAQRHVRNASRSFRAHEILLAKSARREEVLLDKVIGRGSQKKSQSLRRMQPP